MIYDTFCELVSDPFHDNPSTAKYQIPAINMFYCIGIFEACPSLALVVLALIQQDQPIKGVCNILLSRLHQSIQSSSSTSTMNLIVAILFCSVLAVNGKNTIEKIALRTLTLKVTKLCIVVMAKRLFRLAFTIS
jgi:hypothetical protein